MEVLTSMQDAAVTKFFNVCPTLLEVCSLGPWL
jgi:hypothetical protein